MPSSKEIRTKIKSVRNTQKITKAMEMVAASKRKRAQERMVRMRPYSERIREIVSQLALANPEYRHPFLLNPRGAGRTGMLVVCSDKGLCGGLNTNLLRGVLGRIKEMPMPPLVTCLGNKALGFLSRLKVEVISHAVHLGDNPAHEQFIGPMKIMFNAFTSGKVDRVFIAYNRFVNTMKQEPIIEQLLPITPDKLATKRTYTWDYIYEPEAQPVLDDLLVRYVEALIYQAVVENIACEQSARMVAMKAASENAVNVIDELQLIYNKARQAAITKEIAEIVGGASAV